MRKSLLCCVLLVCLTLSACSSASDPANSRPSSAPIIGLNTTTSSSLQQTTQSTVGTTTTGSEGSSSTTTALPDSPQATGQRIAQLAYSLLGSPFKYGGIGPADFDNPGFVYYCYKQHGISIPRRSAAMAQGGQEIDKQDLAEGDIVIFSNEVGGEPSFVGIYTGDGNFVACHNPEKGTVLRDMTTKYYTEHFVTARRYS